MEEEPVSDESYQKRAKGYCQAFAAGHHSLFRPHFLHGETLGRIKEVRETRDKEGNLRIEVVKHDPKDIWRDASRHCLVSAIFADILAEELGLPDKERKNVVAAIIVHDWNKKNEDRLIRNARETNKFTLEHFESFKSEQDALLHKMGFSEDVIELSGATIPETEDGPKSLAEKIAWYVDLTTEGTNQVRVKERLERWGKGISRGQVDEERARMNQEWNNLYRKKYNGKSLSDVQRLIAKRIEQEFVEKLGLKEGASGLPAFLIKKFQERVDSFEPRRKTDE